MKPSRFIALLCLVFSRLLCVTSAAAEEKGGAPVIVFVVRHAEKSAPNGDLPLSPAGQARAETLARMLAPAGVQAIFSTQMIRAKETAAPLAQRTKIEPLIVAVSETDTLVAELAKLPPGAIALVVNHSGTIPTLLKKLGAAAPTRIAEHEYDRMFVVIRDAKGTATALELRYGLPTLPGEGK